MSGRTQVLGEVMHVQFNRFCVCDSRISECSDNQALFFSYLLASYPLSHVQYDYFQGASCHLA